MSESQEDFEEVEQEEVEQEVESQEAEEEISTYIDIESIEDEKLRKQIDARIKKESREKHERERKYQEELKAERERIRKMEEELLTLKKPKEVEPPTPDDFYNDFEAASKRQQEWMESQKATLQYNQEQQEREQRLQAEQQRKALERVQKYEEKVKLAGIDRRELGYAENVVAQSGISQEVANYLLDHPNGPQLVMHLAKNPIETQEIASLNPFQVGEKLNQLAAKFQPNRKSKAPPPDDPIKSTSAVKEESPWLKGAKFE